MSFSLRDRRVVLLPTLQAAQRSSLARQSLNVGLAERASSPDGGHDFVREGEPNEEAAAMVSLDCP